MSTEFEKQQEAALEAFLAGETDDFDMYARDPQDFAALAEVVPGLVITSAGGICPLQVSGTILGHPFYYRERHGWAELRVGGEHTDADDELHILSPHWEAAEQVEEFRDGPGWADSLINLIPRLERGTFLFEFPCARIVYDDPDDLSTGHIDESTRGLLSTSVRGVDEADAIRRCTTFEFSQWLADRGIDEQAQRLDHALRVDAFVLKAVSPDTRIFPEVFPDFRLALPPDALLVWDELNGYHRIRTPWAPQEVYLGKDLLNQDQDQD